MRKRPIEVLEKAQGVFSATIERGENAMQFRNFSNGFLCSTYAFEFDIKKFVGASPQDPTRKCGPCSGVANETGGSEDAKTPLCTTWRYGFARSQRDLTKCILRSRANPTFAQNTAVDASPPDPTRMSPRPYAHVWPLIGRGETGRSEDAKTPLCTTWRCGFARSR